MYDISTFVYLHSTCLSTWLCILYQHLCISYIQLCISTSTFVKRRMKMKFLLTSTSVYIISTFVYIISTFVYIDIYICEEEEEVYIDIYICVYYIYIWVYHIYICVYHIYICVYHIYICVYLQLYIAKLFIRYLTLEE